MQPKWSEMLIEARRACKHGTLSDVQQIIQSLIRSGEVQALVGIATELDMDIADIIGLLNKMRVENPKA